MVQCITSSTAACIIKQEAEKVQTLHSLISVLDSIEEVANNVQLTRSTECFESFN